MTPIILLPKNIYILRDRYGQDLVTNREEYSIYYKNIIHPYSPEYDIKIKCSFGMNIGRCYRLDSFDNCPESFPLTLCIYLYGEKLAEKTVTVHIETRTERPVSVMCIGDSMTQAETYIAQMADKTQNVKTLGTRKIGHVYHEGRGGLTLESYLFNYRNKGWFVSPFLFPKGIDAKEYYGDLSYMEDIRTNPNHYTTVGFTYEPIKDGMYTLKNGELYLYNSGEYTLIDHSPEFCFDFGKYMERFGIETPDIITLLFGANDLQITDYENTGTAIETMLKYADKMISEFRKYGIKIVINLPICGADQYCWGTRMGCNGTVKQYDYNIKMWGNALLEAYDGREQDGIYICPMLAVCDPEAGFPQAVSCANIYSEKTICHLDNWVHPNESGYKQMGDALAGVITKLKESI